MRPTSWIEMIFWAHGYLQLFYKSRGLYRYKKKFTSHEDKRYLVLDPSFSVWKQLWALLVATFSMPKVIESKAGKLNRFGYRSSFYKRNQNKESIAPVSIS